MGYGIADGNNSVAINGATTNSPISCTISNSFTVLQNYLINQSNVSVIPASLLLYDSSSDTSGEYAFANNTSRVVCLSTPSISGNTTKNITLPLDTILSVNRVSLICLSEGTIAFSLSDGGATPILSSPAVAYSVGQSVTFTNVIKAYPAFRIATTNINGGTFRILIEGILLATL